MTTPQRINRHARIAIAAAVAMTIGADGAADELSLPKGPLRQGDWVDVTYRLARPASGTAVLTYEWSDSHGRLIEAGSLSFSLRRETAVGFALDLARAKTLANRIEAQLVLDGIDETGAPLRIASSRDVTFVVTPADRDWWDFQLIMWQQRTPLQYATLKQMGVTAGMVFADRDARGDAFSRQQIEPLLAQGLRWYVGNAATDFYAAYHRWFPDRPVNWAFLEAKRRHREDRSSLAPFMREPSLSDTAWIEKIRARMAAVVQYHRPFAPLYYSLADEAGIADLAAPWDFDFSPASLAAMRQWLQTQYADVAALNHQWGSAFRDWESVVPMRTTEAMARTDDNFSAWSDFKEWMDESFMKALQAGAAAVKQADPEARVAIEGAQIPGWGGYDYGRLTLAVDTVEIYDYGGNVDLVRSFSPDTRMLSTVFGGQSGDVRRLWRSVLHGAAGAILWDPEDALVRQDGSLGDNGRMLAPHLREIRRGLGALLASSHPRQDPVAIVYSPASIRTRWMLDFRALGESWIERTAENEYNDSLARSSMSRYREALDQLGVSARYVTAEQIERGALAPPDTRVLILPQAIAMSGATAESIRAFMQGGGTVVFDVEPGQFDRHGRRLAAGNFADLFDADDVASRRRVGQGRLLQWTLSRPPVVAEGRTPVDPEFRDGLQQILANSNVAPAIDVETLDGRTAEEVEFASFDNGQVSLLSMLPLSQDAPAALRLRLPRRSYAYDVRSGTGLGRVDELIVNLGRDHPGIIAFAPTPLPAPVMSGPRTAKLGTTVALEIAYDAARPWERGILRVEVVAPAGATLPHYGANMRVDGEKAGYSLPIALNDPTGTWIIRVTDVLSGLGSEWPINVEAY